METKQPVDLPLEPDLQEHRRLIERALARNAARKMARVAQEAGAPSWMVWVSIGAGVLVIAAVAALIVAGMVLLQ